MRSIFPCRRLILATRSSPQIRRIASALRWWCCRFFWTFLAMLVLELHGPGGLQGPFELGLGLFLLASLWHLLFLLFTGVRCLLPTEAFGYCHRYRCLLHHLLICNLGPKYSFSLLTRMSFRLIVVQFWLRVLLLASVAFLLCGSTCLSRYLNECFLVFFSQLMCLL